VILNDLRELVIQLDCLLTGKPRRDAEQTARHQAHLFTDAVTFILDVQSNSYYLSDGGYSRLVCNEDQGIYGVSFVSTDAVKARWNEPEVQIIVTAANVILLTAIQHG